MSIVKKALAFAKEMKMNDKEAMKTFLQKSKYNKTKEAELIKKVCKTLKEFDGIKGLSLKDDSLYQNGCLRAEMDVKYEVWDNPNCDYKLEEYGNVIRWIVWYNDGTIKTTGCDLDSFAENMAEFMK